MNYTTAACGHQVYAWGAPGSKIREESERSLCGPCREKQTYLKSQHQQRVERFMGLAGQDVPAAVTIPDAETRLLRARLIFEEAMETIEALGFDLAIAGFKGDCLCEDTVEFRDTLVPDLVGIVDGCADLSVVTIGTLSACGVPDLPVIQEVDRANLRKFEGDAHRDPQTGKWIKPSDFVPPDVEGLLRRLGWEGE